MNKIWVVGLGPGHPDYMLPVALKRLQDADRIYGGSRHLSELDVKGDKVIIKMPLEQTIEDIKNHYRDEQVAVLVSGDTGFYSFLDTLKRSFDDSELETYPGISSLQYLFSKLNKTYQNALITSVHGRMFDLESMFKYKTVGLLTDSKMTPKALYDYIKANNKKATLYIGENLSYEDECITKVHTTETINDNFSKLCVVVIDFE